MSSDTTASLLFELGTEELPAGTLEHMATALCKGISDGLKAHGLAFEKASWFATPRRLSAVVMGVTRAAADSSEQVLGPPAAAAKDKADHWTGAATGFARKHGITPEDLILIDTDKGPRLGLQRTVLGAKLTEVAGQVLSDAVAAIPVAKRMRWGRGRHEFLRPVQWLVALLDENVIPLELFGLTADRLTYGHRFHAPDAIALRRADDYQAELRNAWVIADFKERRQLIREQVMAIAAADNAVAVISDPLLNEVTGLVEWPVALKGSFDNEFLAVPAQALISSMREHQKYFHLLNSDQQLLPAFIAVSNIDSSRPATVVQGNEKVIRPRLSDAAFFFENDKKTTLASRQARLNGVVFQHQLGTLADKTQRISALARWLAETLDADSTVAERGAELAKCDLVSEMVLEFPDLQGIAGAHYANHDGEQQGVVEAIEQHYWPKFSGDALPQSKEAAAVALADRFDTMVGIFGIGQHPSGSKDPFALRRASVAIIRLLIAVDSPVGLAAIGKQAVTQFAEGVLASDVTASVCEYTLDRLRAWYEDQGISVGVLRAVLATGNDNPADIDRRVRALNEFAQSASAQALAAANKRVANILAKSADDLSGDTQAASLVEPEEILLFERLSETKASLPPLLAEKDYRGALTVLAQLQAPVDAFFDKVMVNCDEADLRRNRHRLLTDLRNQFVSIADIAQM